MAGFGIATGHGSADFNDGDLVMPNPWLRIVNLADLWVPQSYRGRDQQISRVPGRRKKPRRRDVAEWTLRFHLSASAQWDEETPTSPTECLELNLDHLKDVCEPGAGGTLVLTKPSGAQVTGDVHLLVHTEEIGAAWCRGSIDVILPDGDWTPVP